MFGGPLQEFIGYIIESSSIDGLTNYTPQGFQDAFLIMPVLIIIACFISLLIEDNTEYD